VPTTITVSGLSCDHNIALRVRSLDGTYHLQQGLINGKHHWKGRGAAAHPKAPTGASAAATDTCTYLRIHLGSGPLTTT
jgi:hypothetical protein